MAEEKHEDLLKKTCHGYLNPDPLKFRKLGRGDHSKQLRPCLYVVQKLSISIPNSYWGKNGLLSKFYIYLFRREKINQLKASKILRFFLT